MHRLRAIKIFEGSGWNPAQALRQALQKNYGPRDLRADVLAGVVVGIVALPLSMALAIASGVPPQHGLYTAIIAGTLIALLGGSRFQVSGPTAAFVVILAPIASRHGLTGLLVATMIAGVFQMIAGFLRFGRLVEFIPYPVTTGFTAGIAVVIATLQIKDLFGLQIAQMPDHYLDRIGALWHALPSLQYADLGIGVLTFALLVGWPRINTKIPAPLIALGVAAIFAFGVRKFFPDFHPLTIADRFTYLRNGLTFHGIPQTLPTLHLPWLATDGTAAFVWTWDNVQTLLGPAGAIAILGAIESLLSAVIADGITRTAHDPDAELVAQGIGNIVTPFFGGIAATGAIARTATNIRSGARSPIAAVVHSLVVLLTVLSLAPLLGALPLAALAALLILVAWNMSEAKHFLLTLRVAPLGDVMVLLSCFSLTVIFDMVVAVTAGMLLAALLLVRRITEISGVTLMTHHKLNLPTALPSSVLVYDIAGPLFFGAAQKAMSALGTIHEGIKVVILDVSDVPGMDATGMVNLQSTFERLKHQRVKVIVAGLQPQPRELLEHWQESATQRDVLLCASLEESIARARLLI